MNTMPVIQAIPRIDIAALGSGDAAERRAVAAAVGNACREVGFFVIEGHGVSTALMADAFKQSARFFAQPTDAKSALSIDKLCSNRGYVGLGVEALDEKAGADHKEAFNLIWTDGETRPANAWPSSLPGFKDVVQRYFDAVLNVGRALHVAFALDLGLDETFFADKIDKPLATLRRLH
jgi:isopenicillin N synthase-like dioxygenase